MHSLSKYQYALALESNVFLLRVYVCRARCFSLSLAMLLPMLARACVCALCALCISLFVAYPDKKKIKCIFVLIRLACFSVSFSSGHFHFLLGHHTHFRFGCFNSFIVCFISQLFSFSVHLILCLFFAIFSFILWFGLVIQQVGVAVIKFCLCFYIFPILF